MVRVAVVFIVLVMAITSFLNFVLILYRDVGMGNRMPGKGGRTADALKRLRSPMYLAALRCKVHLIIRTIILAALHIYLRASALQHATNNTAVT